MPHDSPPDDPRRNTPATVHIQVNGTPRDVPQGTTITQLLRQLDITAQAVAVEVNFELVPRARHAEHRLCEADRLEVVTLVGGG